MLHGMRSHLACYFGELLWVEVGRLQLNGCARRLSQVSNTRGILCDSPPLSMLGLYSFGNQEICKGGWGRYHRAMLSRIFSGHIYSSMTPVQSDATLASGRHSKHVNLMVFFSSGPKDPCSAEDANLSGFSRLGSFISTTTVHGF